MNIMTEQIFKMVAAKKITAWGVKHGSLVLVLDKGDNRTVTKDTGAKIDQLTKPVSVNEEITAI